MEYPEIYAVDFDKTLNNPVITLSTCTSRGSDSGERNVVHAVLDKAGIDPKVDKMEEQFMKHRRLSMLLIMIMI